MFNVTFDTNFSEPVIKTLEITAQQQAVMDLLVKADGIILIIIIGTIYLGIQLVRQKITSIIPWLCISATITGTLLLRYIIHAMASLT